MNVLHFWYKFVDQFLDGGGDDFFSALTASEMKRVNANYSLRFTRDDRSVAVVDMIDIMYRDIQSVYDDMVERFDKDKVDELVVRDEKIIRKKIKTIIEFYMNEICKTSEINVTFFGPTAEDRDPDYPDNIWHTSIHSEIYSTLQENFTIVNQSFSDDGYTIITIKKRSEANDIRTD